jgi:hypothetical protein
MLLQQSHVLLNRRHAFALQRHGGDYQHQGRDQKMGSSSLVIGCKTNVIIPHAILVSCRQFRFVGTLRSNWCYSRRKAKPI